MIDALEGHTIELEGAGHKEQTRGELLEENDSTTAVSSRSKDENLASFDTLTQFCSVLFLRANLSLLVLGGVPAKLFDH